jgi:hypothetical protein
MNWSHWIRQTHRWLSVAFTLLVLANFAAIGVGLGEQATLAVGFSTLIPLFLLLFTGLYLFALPYATRWRLGRSAR